MWCRRGAQEPAPPPGQSCIPTMPVQSAAKEQHRQQEEDHSANIPWHCGRVAKRHQHQGGRHPTFFLERVLLGKTKMRRTSNTLNFRGFLLETMVISFGLVRHAFSDLFSTIIFFGGNFISIYISGTEKNQNWSRPKLSACSRSHSPPSDHSLYDTGPNQSNSRFLQKIPKKCRVLVGRLVLFLVVFFFVGCEELKWQDHPASGPLLFFFFFFFARIQSCEDSSSVDRRCSSDWSREQ